MGTVWVVESAGKGINIISNEDENIVSMKVNYPSKKESNDFQRKYIHIDKYTTVSQIQNTYIYILTNSINISLIESEN